MERRLKALGVVLGLGAVFAAAPAARAQTNMNSVGGAPYQTPSQTQPYPSSLNTGSLLPALTAPGDSYGYIEQNVGGPGTSPSAYYSRNFFANAPGTVQATPNVYYSSNYAGYAPAAGYSSGYAQYPAYGAANGYVYPPGYTYRYTTPQRYGPVRRVLGRLR